MKFGKGSGSSSIDFSRMADDFRNLDPQDPGAWPVVPRIALLIGIVAVVILGAWWFDWSNQWESLEESRNKEVQLKDTWKDRKRQAVNLDVLKKQLEEIDQQFGALLRQLPNKAQMDALLQDINQVGLDVGLQFERFKPEGDRIHEFYAEMPVQIEVLGTFHELGEFAGGTAKMPRIVVLSDMSIEREKDSELLKMRGNVVTYRYLDSEELKQRSQGQGGR